MRDILVQDEADIELEASSNTSEHAGLLSWIMDHVDAWEDHRDTNYKDRWEEYYRLWRGIWADEDKSRDQERSRIISPALQQAIEVGVSEIEEATFSKRRWFDIDEDLEEAEARRQKKLQLETLKAQVPKLPQEQQQAAVLEVQNVEQEIDEGANELTMKLIEEFELNGVPSAVSETYLNGGLYGTGIGKLVIEDRDIATIEGGVNSTFAVKLVAVEPQQFVIDPAAKSVDDALGMAHIIDVPRHTVIAKINSGTYFDVDVGSHSGEDLERDQDEETGFSDKSEFVRIVEWHGLVPRSLLPVALEDDEEVVEFNFNQQDSMPHISVEEDDLVEAIVTIGNDNVVLKAVENPLIMKDRAFIAYQHDTVPNKFWGRGIAEKGFNSQKGLDAELRARIDGLALATYPMLAIDATRIPRGTSFKVRPGRNILINGDPASAIREFKFTPPSSMSFNQTAEFERMVQMGTGSMDSATPIGISPRNQTASGMSMISAGAMKRSKRTMQNIERNFLDKLVEKAMWRYMQFDNDNFPVKDFTFTVHSTMGIVAREVEQQQLTNLLQTAQPGTPVYYMLIKSMYGNSTLESKEEMMPMIEQMLNQALNPPPPTPDPELVQKQDELKFRMQQHQDQMVIKHKEIFMKGIEVLSGAARSESDAKNKQAEGIKFLAEAEAAEVGTQMGVYRDILNSLDIAPTESTPSTGTETPPDAA